MKLLVPTLDAIVTPRPSPTTTGPQHLCADRGYSGQPAANAMKSRGYKPHVRQRGEEIAAKKKHSRYRPKRWVVERTHSWINRFRKLLVRFEKTEASYLGLLELACALIIFRKVVSIYG